MAGAIGSLVPVHVYTPRTSVGQLNAEFKQIYDTLNGLVSEFVPLSGAVAMTGNLTAPGVRLTSTTELTLASTAHAFQIGLSSTANLAADANEIQARNNGAAAQLDLNPHGGTVTTGANLAVGGSATVGGNTVWHAGNDGAGSGLDADTLDGVQFSAFAHERVFLGVGSMQPQNSVTIVDVSFRPTYNFPDGSMNLVSAWFTLPVWALNTNLTITLYYTSATAGTNVVRLDTFVGQPAVDAGPSSSTTTYTNDITMPAVASNVRALTVTTTHASGSGPLYWLGVRRNGGHANDTFTGAFNLIGVLIRRT